MVYQVLILCDTLYQIILAIQMKETIFEEKCVDIWISDHSVGADKIVNRLKEYGRFRNVTFISSREVVYSKKTSDKVKNLFYYGFGHNYSSDLPDYDEVIFHGLSVFSCGLYFYLNKRNVNTKWSSYEEGILSYDTDLPGGKSVKMLDAVFSIMGKKKIGNAIEQYYCVFPELKRRSNKSNTWEIVKIPDFNYNNGCIRDILALVFDFADMDIKQKYIFFTSSSDWDGRPYGEKEMVLKIADIVGSENLIIKKHPRDKNEYSLNNITIMNSDGVPWEIFQICSDVAGKVLITVDSGSFLSVSAIKQSNAKGVFIFPMVQDKRAKYECFVRRDKNIRDILDHLHAMRKCQNILILSELESLKTI